MKFCDYTIHEEYDIVPRHTLESLERLLVHGIPPGGFLTAVLDNDLRLAVGLADADNRAALHKIVIFVINNLPCGCFGSTGSVKRYIESGQRWWENSDQTFRRITDDQESR
jgi:hypothetical protein